MNILKAFPECVWHSFYLIYTCGKINKENENEACK